MVISLTNFSYYQFCVDLQIISHDSVETFKVCFQIPLVICAQISCSCRAGQLDGPA